jgi:HD-like signal output (HDOD) protein
MLNQYLVDRTAKSHESYWALKGLPPFPAVATRLLELLATDDYGMQDLLELIRADPMFASELLLATNSAKYGLAREVTSIRQAAALLGRETLRSFAVAVSLRMYVQRVAHHDMLAKVWRHSLATAVICETLAECAPETCRNSRDDTPYVAGLLHDIGCLGLMVKHPQEYADALSDAATSSRDLREVERGRFQIDHCAAGQWMARVWKFSPAIGDIALLHHQAPTGEDFTLLELVKVGVLMADTLAYDVAPPQRVMTLPEAAALLPAAARVRFHNRMDALPKHVSQCIQSFEF